MARSRGFTHSVVLGFAGQAAAMLTGLWLSPFLIHHLGDLRFGFWILGQQILVYLSLMDLGVVALLPREVAYAAAREGAETAVSNLLARTLRILAVQTPVVWLLAFGIWFLLPGSWSTLGAPIGIAAAGFGVLFPCRIFRASLEGLQDLSFVSWSYMAGWLAGVTVNVSLIFAGCGLESLAFGWAAGQATDALICFLRIRSKFRFALPNFAAALHSGPLRHQLSRSAWVSMSQIAQVLIYGTDAAVIGRVFGAAAIVPYNCTGKLMSVLANQPQNIMRAAEPGLSQMRVSETQERIASVTSALSLAMLLASGLVVCLTLAVNASFVRWWTGPQYYAGALLTVLFATSMLLRHLNITAIYSLFAFGHERFLALTSLADGVLSTLFSIAFAMALHSPAGVVAGSIASTMCVLIFGNGPRLARELRVSLATLARPLLGWFWRMLLIGWAAGMLGSVTGRGKPEQIVINAFLSAAAYLALMFPVAMRSSLRPYLLPVLSTLGAMRGRSRTMAAALGWSTK